MGGCRCTFRECENGTSARKDLHYFRYPVRDRERLAVWAKNANHMEYLDLPIDKLSNKVVCQEHFERPMFMNELCERLTKLAVPRLMPQPDGTVLNVEMEMESCTSLPAEDAPEPVQSSSEQTSLKIERVDMERKARKSAQLVEPLKKKIKILNSETLIPNKSGTPCEVIRIETSETNGTKRLLQLLNKKASSKHRKASPPVRIAKATIITDENGEPTYSEEEEVDYIPHEIQRSDETGESSSAANNQHDVPNSTADNVVTFVPPPITVPVPDPALMEKMDQNVREIGELKQLVQDLANRPVPQPTVIPAAAPTRVVMEKGPQLTKAQLFSSIKRYLNPSMVTLLRMELFAGSAERPWKPDEKSL
uniref:THAP-type domain-containing protein n=1 Tax=Anopheles maculatus TaxID=74869 RepID=A0A182SWZ5_9DIPT